MAWTQWVQQWVKDQSHWTGRCKKSWPSTWWWYQELWGGQTPSLSYCENTRTQVRQTAGEREPLGIKLQIYLQKWIFLLLCVGGIAKSQLDWRTSESQTVTLQVNGDVQILEKGDAWVCWVWYVWVSMCVQTYLKERPVLSESMKIGALMVCQMSR